MDEERYPYECDFYVVPEDLFIEVNIYATHGKHPFDEISEEDKQLLEELKQKSITSKFYTSYVDMWSVSDVEKRNCAIKNKLNYRMLYRDDLLFYGAEYCIKNDLYGGLFNK